MVAAWISAETGVGPSIASGSQVCSGNWADLPATPASISRRPWWSPCATARRSSAWPSTPGIDVVPAQASSDDDGQQHADVTDPGDQERLDRGGPRRRALAVMADQQVGGQAHDLPADQQQHQVGGVDDEHHRRGEQRHRRGVGRVAGRGVGRALAGQVGHRVQLHAEGDHADRDRDHRGQAVGLQVEAEDDAAGVDPAEEAEDPDRPHRPVPLDAVLLHAGGDQRTEGAQHRPLLGPGAGPAPGGQTEGCRGERQQHGEQGRGGGHEPLSEDDAPSASRSPSASHWEIVSSGCREAGPWRAHQADTRPGGDGGPPRPARSRRVRTGRDRAGRAAAATPLPRASRCSSGTPRQARAPAPGRRWRGSGTAAAPRRARHRSRPRRW